MRKIIAKDFFSFNFDNQSYCFDTSSVGWSQKNEIAFYRMKSQDCHAQLVFYLQIGCNSKFWPFQCILFYFNSRAKEKKGAGEQFFNTVFPLLYEVFPLNMVLFYSQKSYILKISSFSYEKYVKLRIYLEYLDNFQPLLSHLCL